MVVSLFVDPSPDLPKSSFESCGSTPALSSHHHAYGSDNSSNFSCSSSSTASTDRTSGGSSSTRRSSWERGVPIIIMQTPASSSIHSKPHKAHDAAWAAIQTLKHHHGSIGIHHFKLLRRLGHGDIGRVFAAQLRGTPCTFAIKVMDKDALGKRNKLQRMQTERQILECVDHPFLPTLYAHFETEQFSCLVMDFCPGGDLHALRQRPLGKRFSVKAARFYAAEVLLALEYLHMLGIVYRDLKPENVLVREDGHIMLTDFDLCLKCEVKPTVLRYPLPSSSPSSTLASSATPSSLLSSSLASSGKRRLLRSFSQSSTSSSTSFLHHNSANCVLPAACGIHPIISCLSIGSHSSKKTHLTETHSPKRHPGLDMITTLDTKNRDYTASNDDCADEASVSGRSSSMAASKQDAAHPQAYNSGSTNGTSEIGCSMNKQASRENAGRPANASHHRNASVQDDLMFMELVAEPTQARSMSFVGTHEYLAPEMIAGQGHGNAVDWWTFGIFLFELLFGRTPFKGATNDQTLINIVRQQLRFPDWVGIEVGEDAKSLIQGLLNKDPRKRLGSVKGATEIKQHPFFKGINWALIRCAKPPEVPGNNHHRHHQYQQKPHHHQQHHSLHHPHHHHNHDNSKTEVFTFNRSVSKPLPHFEYF